MKKYVIISTIIFLCAFQIGCKGRSQDAPSPSICEESWNGESEKLDSNIIDGNKEEVPQKDTIVKKHPTSSKTNTYSTSISNEKEPDNMRGFDPASEDDMDDNGMSRYMENNDDEGWD